MQGRAHRHGQGRTAKDARLLHLSGPRRSGESSAGVFPSRQVVDCLCGPDPPSTALCVRVQQCARGARARVSEGKGVRGVCVCETQMDPTTERHACGPMAPTVGRAQAGGGGGGFLGCSALWHFLTQMFTDADHGPGRRTSLGC